MNYPAGGGFQPFIGMGVKEDHINIAHSTILLPQEALLAIIKLVTRVKFTSDYVIIANQRVLEWIPKRSNWMYFTFDLIANTYGKGAFINGELVIVTTDGKVHNYLTPRGENDIAANILAQELERFYTSTQQIPSRDMSQPDQIMMNPMTSQPSKSSKICSSCGSDNLSSNKFCTKCGGLLPV